MLGRDIGHPEKERTDAARRIAIIVLVTLPIICIFHPFPPLKSKP
jgi:hypothetical protein